MDVVNFNLYACTRVPFTGKLNCFAECISPLGSESIEVIVFDQNSIPKSDAVVPTATAYYSIFFESSVARRSFAGI